MKPSPGLMDTRSERSFNIEKLSRSLIDEEDRYSAKEEKRGSDIILVKKFTQAEFSGL